MGYAAPEKNAGSRAEKRKQDAHGVLEGETATRRRRVARQAAQPPDLNTWMMVRPTLDGGRWSSAVPGLVCQVKHASDEDAKSGACCSVLLPNPLALQHGFKAKAFRTLHDVPLALMRPYLGKEQPRLQAALLIALQQSRLAATSTSVSEAEPPMRAPTLLDILQLGTDFGGKLAEYLWEDVPSGSSSLEVICSKESFTTDQWARLEPEDRQKLEAFTTTDTVLHEEPMLFRLLRTSRSALMPLLMALKARRRALAESHVMLGSLQFFVGEMCLRALLDLFKRDAERSRLSLVFQSAIADEAGVSTNAVSTKNLTKAGDGWLQVDYAAVVEDPIAFCRCFDESVAGVSRFAGSLTASLEAVMGLRVAISRVTWGTPGEDDVHVRLNALMCERVQHCFRNFWARTRQLKIARTLDGEEEMGRGMKEVAVEVQRRRRSVLRRRTARLLAEIAVSKLGDDVPAPAHLSKPRLSQILSVVERIFRESRVVDPWSVAITTFEISANLGAEVSEEELADALDVLDQQDQLFLAGDLVFLL
eukprot:TRINITY_DN6009_c0_g2_i1.p1 TRINITY_DN6009_c0_g2~~TRINITY_DN6009_c0_g2_i1.p1  ORF type:complete len:534 (+),score=105.58 TRINITY_DN6009_c0_g2_i1:76-1677(+)